jgi:hypothetical protein
MTLNGPGTRVGAMRPHISPAPTTGTPMHMYLMIIFVKDKRTMTLIQHTHSQLRTGHMSSSIQHLGHTMLARTHSQITDLIS